MVKSFDMDAPDKVNRLNLKGTPLQSSCFQVNKDHIDLTDRCRIVIFTPFRGH